MRCKFAFLALLALPLAAREPQYDVFAIRYATIAQFPVASLVKGAEEGRKLDIAMMIWLIRGNGRNIVVDSGFYRDDLVKQWKPVDFIRPDEAVALTGVRADQVTDVIITHAHWDHADGADLFPRARIWIQKDEYEYYSERAGKAGVTVADMDFFRRAKEAGRLELVDGEREIIPGVRVYVGGRHTYASQYAGVSTKRGTVVLASDNLYLYENLEKHLPIAQTFDADANLRAQTRMRTLVRDPKFIVPGHDPAVFAKFKRVRDRVAVIK